MTDRPFYIHEDDSPGKARILEQGLFLFATNGLSATSIRDIARATGLSNPALYKHFKTKQDLALVLFERTYREHLRRLVMATGKEIGFPTRLRAFIATYLRNYDDQPHATIFTTDNFVALWPDVPAEMKTRTARTLLRDIMELGRGDGSVATDSDPDLQMALVLGLLGQVTRQLYFRTLKGPAAKYAAGIETLIRNGLS